MYTIIFYLILSLAEFNTNSAQFQTDFTTADVLAQSSIAQLQKK